MDASGVRGQNRGGRPEDVLPTKKPGCINRDESGECRLLVELTKLVADVNLRGENLVYCKRAVELNLEIANEHAKAVDLRNETGIVSDADMTEQGFRHLGVLHDE
jgi:hypothetical protein